MATKTKSKKQTKTQKQFSFRLSPLTHSIRTISQNYEYWCNKEVPFEVEELIG